jgi:hypothetical protein
VNIMLSDFEHQKAIAQQRHGEIHAHITQHSLTRTALSTARANGLRRGLLRRVVQVSDRAGHWLLNLSARLEATVVNTVEESPMRGATRVR